MNISDEVKFCKPIRLISFRAKYITNVIGYYYSFTIHFELKYRNHLNLLPV